MYNGFLSTTPLANAPELLQVADAKAWDRFTLVFHPPRSTGKPEENVLCQCSIIVRQLPARNVQINVVLCGINLSPL